MNDPLNRFSKTAVAAALAGCIAVPAFAAQPLDFGVKAEKALAANAESLFGFGTPLTDSAPESAEGYRNPSRLARGQVRLAQGLKAEYLTRAAADSTDMMAFYPSHRPTHLITCVEGEREVIGKFSNGAEKYNPSVQRIDLQTGQVETLLRGLTGCDGIRATPWGTILATEEEDDGGAYEILDPLAVKEQTVLDRASGAVTDPVHIVKRTALPVIAFEGLAVLPSGVVIAGDELRPGTDPDGDGPLGGEDLDGGAIFKFIPASLRPSGGGIRTLAESPLAQGTVYAMQASCEDDKQQYGQGCEIGNAGWIPVGAATARADAEKGGATGYYRPEDLHQDPKFADPAHPDAVRVCWTDTGNEGASNYAEVVCAVDLDPGHAPVDEEGAPARTVVAQRFIAGNPDFNSFDNLDFQSRTGNLYVVEDHENGDIFACLPDGADRDIQSDGCVKMLSVKDSSAEPTGFIFSPDGRTAYLSLQGSDDANMPKVDDYRTDDVLKITGFTLPARD